MIYPLPFAPGDAVKLTDRYANTLMRAKKNKIDWRARRGIVGWCGPSQVAIAWPGLRSLDQVPHKGVEKVKGAGR